jgi:molybdopterin-guanine dinucleotide biosynthesis protein A
MELAEGFILVGGASRRMGADKFRLQIAQETFVARISREMARITSSVSLVGRPDQDNLGFKLVPDVHPQWGALGGVHAALAASKREWALIVACDLPLVEAPLFDLLFELTKDADAVAPIQPDGRRQPLCTLYRVATCLVVAEALIKCNERKPIALLQSVATRWVEFSEFSSLPRAKQFFDNINTPQDYERLSERNVRAD